MKRFISILLFSVYLLSATEAHQLLKLPVMLEHFVKHQTENPDISFLQFLKLHYFNGDPRDADYEEDMKLPFKTADNCSVSFSPGTVSNATTFATLPAIFVRQTEQIPSENSLNPSAYINAIFQPPKA